MDLSTLMRRIQQGDREAFATLYTRYNKTVYRIALDATQNPDEALQVVKAVFKEMYQTIRTKGPYLGDLYGWLDALTAKQIRLRRLTAPPAPAMRPADRQPADAPHPAFVEDAPAPRCAARNVPGPRSYSPEEAAALQQRAVERLQRMGVQDSASADKAPADIPASRPAKPAQRPAVLPYAKTQQAQPEQAEKPVKPEKRKKKKAGRREAYDELDAIDSRNDADEPDDEFGDEPEDTRSGALSIVLLSITALALLWVLIGLLGTLQVLPELPLGYAWFNQTVFPLF